ncbi:hypothetical protein ACH5RR_012293 [Cinchona calisaya]|uniref:Reverse transcriptase domain-containing protein n=1 Tax=Cinchona calisaya TaxID=153742 RepID=A0ABD3A7E2_9GENT
MESIEAIKEVLQDFSIRSELILNREKSHIYFSFNTDAQEAEHIAELLEIQKAKDLGRYLGFPIFHKRITKNSCKFILDKWIGLRKAEDANVAALVGLCWKIVSKSMLFGLKFSEKPNEQEFEDLGSLVLKEKQGSINLRCLQKGEQKLKVRDLIDPNGSRKQDSLSFVLPEEILNMILSFPKPCYSNLTD